MSHEDMKALSDAYLSMYSENFSGYNSEFGRNELSERDLAIALSALAEYVINSLDDTDRIYDSISYELRRLRLSDDEEQSVIENTFDSMFRLLRDVQKRPKKFILYKD